MSREARNLPLTRLKPEEVALIQGVTEEPRSFFFNANKVWEVKRSPLFHDSTSL